MAGQQFLPGHEYKIDEQGTTAVYSGNPKKPWVSPEQYMSMKGADQPQFDAQSRIIRRLDKAHGMANQWDATGLLGGLESKYGVGGTAGFDLDKYLVPVRGSQFVKNLQSMRENSPTGAAIGNPTEKEGEKVESTDAILHVGQNRKQLQGELGELRTAITGRTKGLDPSNPIDLAEVGDPAAIPQGAYFRAANGKVYANHKGSGAPGSAANEDEIRALLTRAQKYRTSNAPMGAATNPWVPTSQAEYDKVPKGAYYLHPDSAAPVRKK